MGQEHSNPVLDYLRAHAQVLSASQMAGEASKMAGRIITKNAVVGICARNGIALTKGEGVKRDFTGRAAGYAAFWTDEKRDELRQCYAQGLMLGEICVRLSCTTNSLAWVRQFVPRPPEMMQAVRSRAALIASAVQRAGQVQKPVLPPRHREGLFNPDDDAWQPVTGSRPLRIEALRGNSCRWPLGDPQDHENFRFCGGDAVPGKPYCACHIALSVAPRRAAPSVADPRLAVKTGLRFDKRGMRA